MSKKSEVIRNLTTDQKTALLSHFNSIYECTELSDHENNIIYLAWMWANGLIYKEENGMSTFEESLAGVPLTDYEIDYEDDLKAGINLDLTYSFYNIDEIIKLMKWKKIS